MYLKPSLVPYSLQEHVTEECRRPWKWSVCQQGNRSSSASLIGASVHWVVKRLEGKHPSLLMALILHWAAMWCLYILFSASNPSRFSHKEITAGPQPCFHSVRAQQDWLGLRRKLYGISWQPSIYLYKCYIYFKGKLLRGIFFVCQCTVTEIIQCGHLKTRVALEHKYTTRDTIWMIIQYTDTCKACSE